MTEIFSSCVAVFKRTQAELKQLTQMFSESTTFNLLSHAYVQLHEKNPRLSISIVTPSFTSNCWQDFQAT